mgnify:CR=1 FL=1
MATAEEYLAGAERAKAAGDVDAEAYFRQKAAEAGPVFTREQLTAAENKAKAAGDTEAADYFAELLKLAPPSQNRADPLMPPPAANLPPPPAGGDGKANIDTFGDTAKDMASGPASAAATFGGALLSGGKDSPSLRAIANDPWLNKLPNSMQAGLGFAGDVGGGALSALGAGLSGAVGLAAELVPGQGKDAEAKLAGDLLDMSMFAAPELAGSSSAALSASRGGALRSAEALPPPIPPSAAITPAEVGGLARKASGGSAKATAKLADATQLNTADLEASKRLGIDLPADVFSDNPAIKSAAGLTRSKVASEPEAAWLRSVTSARDRADELLASIGGTTDIASISDSVKSTLSTAQKTLKDDAAGLYAEVDSAIEASQPVQVQNTVAALNKTIEALGGIDGMTAQEKALYKMVAGDQPITYGRILREKSLIGKALAAQESPYSSLDKATLKQLYGALAEDQMAAVATVGDGTLAAKLKSANELTARQKALEEKMVSVFGNDLAGSIAPKLKSAISKGAKGDVGDFIRVMKVVPEELRKEVVATALTASTRSARASSPGFGISEFVKTFGGLQDNKPMMSALGVHLGPEGMQMLNDLYSVGKRIQVSDSYVLRTGKANQAVTDGLMADGLVQSVLQSSIGKRAVKGASIAGGTMIGGPGGAVAADALTASLMEARPDVLLKAGRLFASEEFKNAAISAAQKNAVSPELVGAVEKSPAFKAWASAAGIDNPQAWLSAAFPATAAAGEAANANSTPYDRLYQRYGK